MAKPLHNTSVILCILDGWGWRSDGDDNAIALANTPNYDKFLESCPVSKLATSGLAVGLPDGQMGNSEVGHMNIGGGRVVMQDLPRIDSAIASGDFLKNEALADAVAKARRGSGTVHIMGLLSPGGVHSHQDHIAAAANHLAAEGLDVRVHAFLDGRDTPPKSAKSFVNAFTNQIRDRSRVRFGAVSGRYFAMDRDKRWDRVERAYAALVNGAGERAQTAEEAIDAAYANEQTDEFVAPTVVDGFDGMQDGDAVIMMNFRADRAREILQALLDPQFDGFERINRPNFSAAKGLVEYSEELNAVMQAMYPLESVANTLGEVVSSAGKTQLRIAETEKYAHVTFFLNGGRETVFENEERVLVPSPKVATYDLKPEMSAHEVTSRLVDAVAANAFDLIVANFANPDMVGHTGDLTAAISAVQTIDWCLGELAKAARAQNNVLLITADHGNVEMMRDSKTDAPHTAHTNGPVPFVMINSETHDSAVTLEDGRLADIAPTVLEILGVEKPIEMTGHSLIQHTEGAKDQAQTRVTARP
jgi:2,3-bisphosphoglycerate-independent phosphoglycerate mutase